MTSEGLLGKDDSECLAENKGRLQIVSFVWSFLENRLTRTVELQESNVSVEDVKGGMCDVEVTRLISFW